MKSDDVLKAAELIEQLNKLKLLSEFDEAPDLITITLRKGKYSKSVSIKDKYTISGIYDIVDKIKNHVKQRLDTLGVEN